MSEKTKNGNHQDRNGASPAEPAELRKITRRGFIKGAGLTAASASVLEGVHVLARAAESQPPTIGPEGASIQLQVNNRTHSVAVEPRTTLAEALRFNLGLTGTKVVCDRGSCSACTVWLDKTPVCSCMTLAVDVGGRAVTTIEGLAHGDQLHPVQAAFIEHDALQCGFCTPGMIMSCAALLARSPHAGEAEVRSAISGNLCRCGTYPKVVDATLSARSAKWRS